jgi:hypothetical protein
MKATKVVQMPQPRENWTLEKMMGTIRGLLRCLAQLLFKGFDAGQNGIDHLDGGFGQNDDGRIVGKRFGGVAELFMDEAAIEERFAN